MTFSRRSPNRRDNIANRSPLHAGGVWAEVHAEDPVLSNFVAAVEGDAATLGVLLHGSRAGGRPRDDSDYDLIRIVTQEAYDARRERGQLHERVSLDDGSSADVLYQTPSRIATYISTPGW